MTATAAAAAAAAFFSFFFACRRASLANSAFSSEMDRLVGDEVVVFERLVAILVSSRARGKDENKCGE